MRCGCLKITCSWLISALKIFKRLRGSGGGGDAQVAEQSLHKVVVGVDEGAVELAAAQAVAGGVFYDEALVGARLGQVLLRGKAAQLALAGAEVFVAAG